MSYNQKIKKGYPKISAKRRNKFDIKDKRKLLKKDELKRKIIKFKIQKKIIKNVISELSFLI